MHVTRAQTLTYAVAVAGLLLLQAPGLYRHHKAVDESTAAKREAAPAPQYQATSRIDSGSARAPVSNRAKPPARIEFESNGAVRVAAQPDDRANISDTKLLYIAELENQSVDTALAELLPMLDDEDPAIRRSVVESLGDLGAESAVPALTTALSDADPQVRIIALAGLTAYEATWVVGSIEPYLYDRDTKVRLAAIEALSDLESRTAVNALASLLSDQNPSIRRHAVSALGDIGGEGAMMYLRQARYDPDASVRADSSDILSELAYDAVD